MEVSGANMVITGAGSGIGAALAKAAVKAGANVIVSDRNLEAVRDVAAQIGARAIHADVSIEQDVQSLISQARDVLGPIDIFVSNAGLGRGDPDHAASASDDDWNLNWKVHVMSHVWASRALLPDMISRGSGHLVNVASAAGLLNQIGDAAYSATKHAAVSFAESLAISHVGQGIDVSVVCPQYVATPLIGLDDSSVSESSSLLSADEVAETILSGIKDKKFLILPHPEVAGFAHQRAIDHDNWIVGMHKLRKKVIREFGNVDPQQMHKLI